MDTIRKTALMLLLFIPLLTLRAERTNINREWKFILDNPEGQPHAVEYNDKNWDRVGLPHSFSIPYFRSPNFYVGYGWYRKWIDMPADWSGKQIYLDFDGVFQEAEIFINGMSAGNHQGGYTGFSVDITPLMKPGKNLIAIQVNNLWRPALAPRAGEHVFAGGIYRDVYLRTENPVHMARYATVVTTPLVSEEKAEVTIRTEIENHTPEPVACQVRQIIRDPKGKKIAEFSTRQTAAPNTNTELTQHSGEILRPELWSPEHPVLYTIETEIRQNEKRVSSTTTSFGFRWFKWTADSGFYLNGEHYYLKGVNVHQDHAGWGDAVTQAGIYRDVKLMKDAGFNTIRGSHYPHHPYFAQVCDELGMLFISENNFWGIGGYKPDGYWDASAYPPAAEDRKPFEQSAIISLKEMIRANRNHPSVLAWSMCNEPFFSYPALMPDVRKFLSDMVDCSHQQDPTRIAIIGGAQRGEVDTLGDAAGYNGDGATLYRNPGFPNLVSEYGSCVSDRPGDYTPCWGNIADGEQPRWRAGQAIWCGFDHGSIAGDMGKMGIVDYFRIPKRAWYWYRHNQLGIDPPEWPSEGTPARLRLTADKTKLQGTDGTDDALVTVTILNESGQPVSNSPEVTLTIESGPGEFPTGRSIVFKPTTSDDIRIQDGQAAIEFRSYEGGTTQIRATSAGLQSDLIKIKTTGKPAYREGITPVAPDRAYRPDAVYRRTERNAVTVSSRRPTQVSSFTPQHPALYANDNDPQSAWLPQSSDKQPWWSLDMENFYRVEEIELRLTDQKAADFEIELSRNNRDWEPLPGTLSQPEPGRYQIKAAGTQKARFLRVTFKNSGTGIEEITVTGNS